MTTINSLRDLGDLVTREVKPEAIDLQAEAKELVDGMANKYRNPSLTELRDNGGARSSVVEPIKGSDGKGREVTLSYGIIGQQQIKISTGPIPGFRRSVVYLKDQDGWKLQERLIDSVRNYLIGDTCKAVRSSSAGSLEEGTELGSI